MGMPFSRIRAVLGAVTLNIVGPMFMVEIVISTVICAIGNVTCECY